MNFYNQIVHHYRSIFPLNKAQADFIFQQHPDPTSAVLEIGSALGDLSFSLLSKYKEITGIDLDDKMVKLAQKEIASNQAISFKAMDMLTIDEQFAPHTFKLAVCLGNTLVHLKNEVAVSQLFQKIKQILQPDGTFIFQIINYDRIFEQQLTGLPTIENDQIRFERNYHYQNSDTKVTFETILTIKATGEKLRNSIPLLALRKEQVVRLLKESGFKTIHLYGNFKGEPFTEMSVPLIVKAN